MMIGIRATGALAQSVWGGYDNDGFPDLFMTQYGRNVLYHNNGNGTFTDVTDKAGVAGTESGAFHSGATFFDYDRDGRRATATLWERASELWLVDSRKSAKSQAVAAICRRAICAPISGWGKLAEWKASK
jgi:hypothetical protein